MKRRERKKSRKLWLKIPLAIILVLILGAGGYAFSIYNNAKSTVNDKINEPIDTIDTKVAKKKVKATESLNILLLGIDERDGDRGRSDALVVLSLNPKEDTMQLVSIPRDTRTTIVGKGIQDKINHAYAYGGADMSVATVENFLNINLDYYVRMNMEGLEELIDQLGTIQVDNEVEWDDGQYQFMKGPVELDGDKMMHFVRMRKQDPAGDFGRTERQRKVIEGIIDKGARVGSVNKINGVIDVLGDNMATNMDFDDMKELLFGYTDVRKNVNSYMMQGSGTKIEGVYYYMVPEEEVSKVHGMIAGI
ncbi:LCP family protein [Virgibacillus pantothenticus]|uniref:Transcriptional regulator LytR n=1 Tax=Virgibacillus pantothenticus TaxID=1473 RepID=A0A0L0QJR2_VIRPA|nr:LCP family protein [Virgibacillus pantothenticus]KNE18786.1 transcriptional regulator LytR [Virgibacillus pantothenticus]MED3736776.1 LCP family protein [Virgibacillus pantothenticus]QTY15210.1 LCP family protein [Virgibacillus pantothenticus]SIT05493.1 transcriptional attenuator, LytR family [Virgibacillus pantothenticus]